MAKIEDLPKFLMECRDKLGMSQGEVAQRLGYATPQFVSNWERGLAHPPLDAIHKLCSIYKIKPDVLFQYIKEIKLAQYAATMERKFYGRKGR